jgi:hypothetical protein
MFTCSQRECPLYRMWSTRLVFRKREIPILALYVLEVKEARDGRATGYV